MLLYGSNNWVITEAIMKVLGAFHNQITRSTMGKTERNVRKDSWKRPQVEETIKEDGCVQCHNMYGGGRQPFQSTL